MASPPRSEERERFWTGPIRSRRHARNIIGQAAVAIGGVAVLIALTLIGGIDSSKIIAAVVFGFLAFALKYLANVIVAVIATILTALPLVLGIVAAVSTGQPMSIALLIPVILWALIPLLCLRSIWAARALKTLPKPSMDEVFG